MTDKPTQQQDTKPSRRAELLSDDAYRMLATKAMVFIARDLRQRETPTEDILWEALRARRLGGLKFRRQHPIANTQYVVDFLCYECDLVVEVDGGVHAAKRAQDNVRQAAIEGQGYRVLRFDVKQVEDDLANVLEAILRASHTSIS
jgi:very-short-patch-repair endonuclease